MRDNGHTNPITNTELVRHFCYVKINGMSQRASAKKIGRSYRALAYRLGWYTPGMRDRHRIQRKIIRQGLQHQADMILSSDRSRCWITGVEFTPENLVDLSRSGTALPDLEHCGKRKQFRGWTFGNLNSAMGNAGDNPERILRLAGYLRQELFPVKWRRDWLRKDRQHRKSYEGCRRIFAMYDSCQNCGYVPPVDAAGIDKLHLDHCHTTGFVRGVLCNGCNKAEGGFTKVADYLGMDVERLLELSAEYLRRELPC